MILDRLAGSVGRAGGALVMVIEVLGSRVIGYFFGVSLFVWTSPVTVTLVALAAGYAAGRSNSPRERWSMRVCAPGWVMRCSTNWTLPWVFAASLAALLSLKWHFRRKFVARPWMET